MNNRVFQAAAYMIPLEEGLTRKQISFLLNKLPLEEELVPFQIAENNTTLIGFATPEAYEEHLMESDPQVLLDLCEDWSNEKEDGIYRTETGLDVYVSCDYETIHLGGEE